MVKYFLYRIGKGSLWKVSPVM